MNSSGVRFWNDAAMHNNDSNYHGVFGSFNTNENYNPLMQQYFNTQEIVGGGAADLTSMLTPDSQKN